MANNLRLLDCTLRDGAYVNGGQFGDGTITSVIQGLSDAGVPIIECGWLKDPARQPGSTYFHSPYDMRPFLGRKAHGTYYTAMIDWDRYDLKNLLPNDGTSINAIRVVFPYGKHEHGAAVAERIKSLGYGVMLQAANTLAYGDADLESLANTANKLKPASLSIVDTFGAMKPEDVRRIATTLDGLLDKGIMLGFHGHDNLRLATANALTFLTATEDTGRTRMLDGTLLGMGRGAGNTPTELLAAMLGFDGLGTILDVAERHIKPLRNSLRWGYSPEYMLAGIYQAHVNNVDYLKDGLDASDAETAATLAAMERDKRRTYDYPYVERVFDQERGKTK